MSCKTDDRISEEVLCSEQIYLNAYFSNLSIFAYDKIKAQADGLQKSNTFYCSEWPQMMGCLNKMVLNEKAYATFVYLGSSLGQKLFSRKDTLKNSYESLIIDLKKLRKIDIPEETSANYCKGNFICSATSASMEHVVNCRIHMMKLYEYFYTLSVYGTSIDYEMVIARVQEVQEVADSNEVHPILEKLATLILTELKVLKDLFRLQIKIQCFDYTQSLAFLKKTKIHLDALTCNAAYKEEIRRFGFLTTSNALPGFLLWISNFRKLLVAKFTFYFYEILKKYAIKNDFNKAINKLSIDFYNKLMSMYKKSDASSVAVMLNVETLLSRNAHITKFMGIGYKHPMAHRSSGQGLDNYPAIISHPMHKADRHWPDVVSILNDNIIKTSNKDKIIYFLDERNSCTYFIVHIEKDISIVAIYESKKSDKDTYIMNTLNLLSNHLRNTSIFMSMKSISKN